MFRTLMILVVTACSSGSKSQPADPAPKEKPPFDDRVDEADIRVAYSNPFAPRLAEASGLSGSTGRTKAAVALLVRRQLLLREAAARAVPEPDDKIEDEIKKGRFFVGGRQLAMPVFDVFDGKKCTSSSDCSPPEQCTEEGQCGVWSIRKFNAWVAELNVAKKAYLAEQARELRAYRLARTFSDDKALGAWLQKKCEALSASELDVMFGPHLRESNDLGEPLPRSSPCKLLD